MQLLRLQRKQILDFDGIYRHYDIECSEVGRMKMKALNHHCHTPPGFKTYPLQSFARKTPKPHIKYALFAFSRDDQGRQF